MRGGQEEGKRRCERTNRSRVSRTYLLMNLVSLAELIELKSGDSR